VAEIRELAQMRIPDSRILEFRSPASSMLTTRLVGTKRVRAKSDYPSCAVRGRSRHGSVSSGLWARSGREVADINERQGTFENTRSERSEQLFAFFLLRLSVIINPKVPGSRPGRPTRLAGRGWFLGTVAGIISSDGRECQVMPELIGHSTRASPDVTPR
jgi:hypothetical protein